MKTITPAARVRNGNTCGTACHVFRDAQHSYWLTNAHVVGTRIGHTVNVELLDSRPTAMRAHVVASSYSRGLANDLAILRSPAVDRPFIPIAIDGPIDSDPQISGGSPRCEPTSWKIRHPDPNQGDLQFSDPNSIGGESGSGIVDHTETAIVALLTWTSRGRCLAQTSESVAATLRATYAPAHHTRLPEDAVPACDDPVDCDDTIITSPTTLPDGMFVRLRQTDPGPDPDPDCPPEATRTLEDWIHFIQLILDIINQLPLSERQRIDRSLPNPPSTPKS